MMRWSFQPLRALKSAACIASIFTMCIAPVAHGKAAETDRQLVNDFLKKSGLASGTTVGEYWKQVRHAYPQPLRGQMDIWASMNRNQKMPKIEATSLTTADGKEQIRLNMSGYGPNFSFVLTGNEEKPVKFNNVVLTKKELTNYKNYDSLMRKIAKQDPQLGKSAKAAKPTGPFGANPVLSYKEYSKLTARQRAEYLFKVRLTVQAAQRVFKTKYGAQAAAELESKYKYAIQFLLGEDAEAASNLAGKSCVYAGYLTVYGENGSCGGQIEGERHFKAAQSASIASCPGRDVPCHPMVYGYTSSGSNYCVAHAERKNATAICNQKSPLTGAQDKKRIIESYLAKRGKNVNLVLDAEGKVSKEQYAEISAYLGDLNKYIKDAIGECDTDPLKSVQKVRKDQQWACDAIRTRAFDLQAFATNPTPPMVLPPVGDKPVTVNTCDLEKPGSQVDEKGNCVCPEGTNDEQGQRDDGTMGPACVVAARVGGGGELTPEEPKKDDKCDSWYCNGWIWAGIGVGLLAIWGITKLFKNKKDKKHTDNTYVPPVATDPGTTDTATPTPTTTISPIPAPSPSASPSPSPTVTVPIIDVLPVADSEGGTLTTTEGLGSGVR